MRQEYGAFVQLGKGEKYKDGFLHIGCLPAPPGVERLEVVNSVVREGDKVWVKVRDVDEDSGKYALDMRFVHQEDGRDLDPFNGRGRVPADVGWVFPKQQLKHIQGAAAAITAASGGFGSDFQWRDEAEEKEEALKRMQVESSDESDSAQMTKKAKKVKKKLEKQKKKLEQLKQLSEQKDSKNKENKGKEKKGKKEKKEKKKKSASDDS
ncbi:pnp [Symbiodinium pilosum]|uniref:Pnp protein n=1 Tax=Symbiodinium pilosum TaxID=2952 RepID=A0A812R1W9_SYMPI|nr:pnp [Symbiodinium pilosum]